MRNKMKNIYRFPVILLAILIAGALPLKAGSDLPEKEAREYLKHGALVVDVRTVREYKAGHLTNAVNIPLAELKEKLPGVATNKSAVILLHCQTGGRSGKAERELRAMGYTNAFNIGSYERAKDIVNSPTR
jgi:phage shock protein E